MKNKTIIIAEAGVNHNGNLKMAKSLIDVASDAGADYVKFQTFNVENLLSKNAEKADYQKNITDKNESQYEMLQKLQLSYDTHLELISYCKIKKIKFLSTPFDVESVDMLIKLGVNLIKIPSGEINNLPYLEYIGRVKLPIIISTGMSTMQEIKKALEILVDSGAKKSSISVLHCNSEYPTPMEDVNIKAMLSISEKFGINIGISDHSKGIEVPIAAVALGASIVEKHFTLDKDLKGPDHQASLNPNELKAMVKKIRNIEVALGSGIKKPTKSEIKNIGVIRKSIVAKINIKKGDHFSSENLTTKRPGTGKSPMNWYELIGKKATKDYKKDEMIN